jgi:hypothetical protein
MPFGTRLLALALLMAVAAAVDLARHGSGATRWREYSFLWVLASAAALFGALNDAITVRISPDYFILGKGLAADSIAGRAMLLGAEAGFSAGAAAAALCLFASTAGRRRPPLSLRRLVRLAWRPFVLAATGAAMLQLLAGSWDPLRLLPDLGDAIGAERAAAFMRAWWIHCGAYAGLAAGLAWMLATIVCARSRPAWQPSRPADDPGGGAA